MIEDLEAFEINHVLREKNREADWLANRAMDLGTKPPSEMGGTSATALITSVAAEVSGVVRNGVVVFLGQPLPEGTTVTVRTTKPLGASQS